MGNTIDIIIPFVNDNPIIINQDDLDGIVTVTGIIKPVQFALDWCDDMTLQQSAYLEILSIQKNR